MTKLLSFDHHLEYFLFHGCQSVLAHHQLVVLDRHLQSSHSWHLACACSEHHVQFDAVVVGLSTPLGSGSENDERLGLIALETQCGEVEVSLSHYFALLQYLEHHFVVKVPRNEINNVIHENLYDLVLRGRLLTVVDQSLRKLLINLLGRLEVGNRDLLMLHRGLHTDPNLCMLCEKVLIR